jgi:3-hydroxyacyl-[acyl-carrier-protein] dehydratase
VAKKSLILDPSEYDTNRVVADLEEIRKYNLQRHEMEQLTAICYEDDERHICVGYKDLSPDEFWARGHMPGMPLMPGVIMCEAAAQLASYFARKYDLIEAEVIGFGGLEEVRFRGVVRPGERFVVLAKLLKLRRMLLTCQFQGVVNENLVVEGILKGIALPIDELKA